MQFKKRKPHLVHLLALASACLCPPGLHAQPDAPEPARASEPSQPAAPSLPSTPALPTTPSQPAGVPYPSSIFYPPGSFQPAGTQASIVSDEELPGLQLRALAGVERESNVLRTPGGGTEDRAAILGVGARADLRRGLQRFRADVEANRYAYERDSSLDYNVLNYALAWDWSITPRFHGVLGADRKQYREVATDPVELVNRVGRRTERAELLEAIYEAGAAWRLVGSASHTKASSTEPATWDASPDINSARIGVGYERPSGASLYVRHRRGDGEYTDPTPGAARGDFEEDETDVLVQWPVSGRTSVAARLGHLERRHATDTARDFSGIVGSATVAWQVTGKTRLVAGFGRDLSATGQSTGGRVRSDRYFIGPVWKPTAATAVNVRYDHVSRDWKGVPATSSEAGRNEAVRALSANLEWQPRRWVALSVYVRTERLRSSLPTGYSNNTVGAALKGFF